MQSQPPSLEVRSSPKPSVVKQPEQSDSFGILLGGFKALITDSKNFFPNVDKEIPKANQQAYFLELFLMCLSDYDFGIPVSISNRKFSIYLLSSLDSKTKDQLTTELRDMMHKFFRKKGSPSVRDFSASLIDSPWCNAKLNIATLWFLSQPSDQRLLTEAAYNLKDAVEFFKSEASYSRALAELVLIAGFNHPQMKEVLSYADVAEYVFKFMLAEDYSIEEIKRFLTFIPDKKVFFNLILDEIFQRAYDAVQYYIEYKPTPKSVVFIEKLGKFLSNDQASLADFVDAVYGSMFYLDPYWHKIGLLFDAFKFIQTSYFKKLEECIDKAFRDADFRYIESVINSRMMDAQLALVSRALVPPLVAALNRATMVSEVNDALRAYLQRVANVTSYSGLLDLVKNADVKSQCSTLWRRLGDTETHSVSMRHIDFSGSSTDLASHGLFSATALPVIRQDELFKLIEDIQKARSETELRDRPNPSQ